MLQIGPGCDELNPSRKVPRMLGYRSMCVEGPVDGEEPVEELNKDQEKVLRSAKKARSGNAKKDEKKVDKLLETFFDKYADAHACEMTNRGKRPKEVLDRIAAEEAAEAAAEAAEIAARKVAAQTAAQAAVLSAAHDVGAQPDALAAVQEAV